MGEIFTRARPSVELRFTGERMTGSMHGQIEIEHLHRYFLAREACRGLDVLDIACGEGYGSDLLAQVARTVVGVDVSAEAVEFASQAYVRGNLRFQTGDGREIPIEAASVDVIVSFETLEHLYEQEQLVAEFRRVLRPGGLLLISTPDRNVYSPDGSVPNRYHVRELDQAEFLALLRPAFPEIRLFHQRPMIGSAILPADPVPSSNPPLTFERRAEDHFEASQGLPRALYFVAYCSDRAINVPSSSVYVETSQLELRAAEAARKQEELRVEAARKQEELRVAAAAERGIGLEGARLAKRQMALLRAELDEQLRRSTEHLRDEEQRLLRETAAVRSRLESIEQSTFWRLSLPLRRALTAFPRLRRLARGALKLTWWTVTFQLPSKLREREQIMANVAARAIAGENAVPEQDPGRGSATAIAHADARSSLVEEPAAPEVFTSGPAPSMEEQAAAQRKALGLHLPTPALSIAVGVVTFGNDPIELERCLGSAKLALSRAGGAGRVLAIDNGPPSVLPDGVERIASVGNVGFGAAHNLLMQAAFAEGADIYVATNPDGLFHPDCLLALARMHNAHGGRALMEAVQFPAEHPKVYDAVSFETPWASGACMAIPRAVYEKIGGFDDAFFMYCEDVDISWRARANGFSVLINPTALFLHAVTNRPASEIVGTRMRQSGHLLASKWGNTRFQAWAAAELAGQGEGSGSEHPVPVPADWRHVADFEHYFSFSTVRW